MALGRGMKHWGCGLYPVCTNDESSLTLTYFIARSILIPNAFIWQKTCAKCLFFFNCLEAEINTCKKCLT